MIRLWDTRVPRKEFLTKRDIYKHFGKQAEQKYGFIICITLPRNVIYRPPWPDQRYLNAIYYATLEPKWRELRTELNEYLDAHLIVIEENGIHINGVHFPIHFP
ncbi:MAG: hypothetical protein QXQ94_08825 [Candidatus Bathyarchaeia archaeon]